MRTVDDVLLLWDLNTNWIQDQRPVLVKAAANGAPFWAAARIKVREIAFFSNLSTATCFSSPVYNFYTDFQSIKEQTKSKTLMLHCINQGVVASTIFDPKCI